MRLPRAIRALGAAALLLAGACATSTTLTQSGAPAAAVTARTVEPGAPPVTLLMDCQAPRLGTTVHFRRIPDAAELNDLSHLDGLERVVLELSAWPEGYAPLQALEHAPAGVEVAVVLPGYPATARQTEAWNLLQARVRIIIVAHGEPPDRLTTLDLNRMRGLERLVIWTDDPSAFRPERLVVPVSLRVMR